MGFLVTGLGGGFLAPADRRPLDTFATLARPWMGRPSPRLADSKKRTYAEKNNSDGSDFEPTGASSGDNESEAGA